MLSWVFTFDREDDFYEFAYCYPYTYSMLQREIQFLQSMVRPGCFRPGIALPISLQGEGSSLSPGCPCAAAAAAMPLWSHVEEVPRRRCRATPTCGASCCAGHPRAAGSTSLRSEMS